MVTPGLDLEILGFPRLSSFLLSLFHYVKNERFAQVSGSLT